MAEFQDASYKVSYFILTLMVIVFIFFSIHTLLQMNIEFQITFNKCCKNIQSIILIIPLGIMWFVSNCGLI